MTPERFSELFNNAVKEAHRLAVVKGGEYAPGKDRLENFKKNAEALGLEPEAVWAVYAGKHWDSLQTYVRDISSGRDRKRSEPIEGRFMDMIVYMLLGLGLLEDRRRVTQELDPDALYAKYCEAQGQAAPQNPYDFDPPRQGCGPAPKGRVRLG